MSPPGTWALTPLCTHCTAHSWSHIVKRLTSMSIKIFYAGGLAQVHFSVISKSPTLSSSHTTLRTHCLIHSRAWTCSPPCTIGWLSTCISSHIRTEVPAHPTPHAEFLMVLHPHSTLPVLTYSRPQILSWPYVISHYVTLMWSQSPSVCTLPCTLMIQHAPTTLHTLSGCPLFKNRIYF